MDLTSIADIDFDLMTKTLLMVKDTLGNDVFEEKVTELAARYLFDHPDAENFTDCPSLQKVVSTLPNDKKRELILFKESKQKIKEKMQRASAVIIKFNETQKRLSHAEEADRQY